MPEGSDGDEAILGRFLCLKHDFFHECFMPRKTTESNWATAKFKLGHEGLNQGQSAVDFMRTK